MSRVGRQPLEVPKGVSVQVDGSIVTVKGPKGQLVQEIRPEVRIEMENDVLTVVRADDQPKSRSFHGLYRKLIGNMVHGVSQGFARNLLINGVGYRAEVKGKVVALNLGYSTQIEYVIPDGITVEAEGPNKLSIKGIDKELVGRTASEIRKLRPPEPYKGKGIKYEEEVIRRKVGKSGVK